MYEEAVKIYGLNGACSLDLDADKRISYEAVGRLHAGFLERRPVAIALGDYALELKVTTGKCARIGGAQ